MTWILWNILGACSLAICGSFFRGNPWGLSMFWMLVVMVPLTTFGTQLSFASAYRLAPTFFQAWFVGSAFSAVAGWTASVLIFGERPEVWHVAGMILIGGGIYCLIK